MKTTIKIIWKSIPSILRWLLASAFAAILFLPLNSERIKHSLISDIYLVPAWVITLFLAFFLFLIVITIGAIRAAQMAKNKQDEAASIFKKREPTIILCFRDEEEKLVNELTVQPIFHKINLTKNIDKDLIREDKISELLDAIENENSIGLSSSTIIPNILLAPVDKKSARTNAETYAHQYNDKVREYYETLKWYKKNKDAVIELKIALHNTGGRPAREIRIELFIPSNWKIFQYSPLHSPKKPEHPEDHYRSLLKPKINLDINLRNTILNYNLFNPKLTKSNYIGPDYPLKVEKNHWKINYYLYKLSHSLVFDIEDTLWLLPSEEKGKMTFDYEIHADNMTLNILKSLTINSIPSTVDAIDK